MFNFGREKHLTIVECVSRPLLACYCKIVELMLSDTRQTFSYISQSELRGSKDAERLKISTIRLLLLTRNNKKCFIFQCFLGSFFPTCLLEHLHERSDSKCSEVQL